MSRIKVHFWEEIENLPESPEPVEQKGGENDSENGN